MVFVILTGILLLLSMFYLWKNKKFYILYWKIRGPFGLPFFGIAHKLRNKETFLIEMEKMAEQYGSIFVSWIGQKCILYCADPNTTELLFRSPYCYNKTSLYEILNDVLGGGLFTANGAKWVSHSKVMKPTFKRRPILNFYSTFKSESNNFLGVMKKKGSIMDGFSMFNYIQMMTLRITFETTLGSDAQNADRNFDSILEIFQIMTESLIKRLYQPLFHNRILYQLTPHGKKTSKIKEKLNTFVDRAVYKKQNEFETNSHDSVVEQSESDLEDSAYLDKTFLDYIIRTKEKYEFTLTDIRNEIQVLISAGFETTAVGLYSTITFLAMHPDIQEKLFEELEALFPHKNFDICERDCKKLTYTEMCINESLRLAAPVPIVGRITGEDIKLENGIIVPKGTELLFDIFNMQRSTKIWGPDAKKYNPENFRPGYFYNKHPYAFIPFTKGARMCIGFHYTYAMTKIFLAKLFRNYKITTDMKLEDLVFVNKISIKYKEHPNFKIEQRER